MTLTKLNTYPSTVSTHDEDEHCVENDQAYSTVEEQLGDVDHATQTVRQVGLEALEPLQTTLRTSTRRREFKVLINKKLI